jgi:serine-type D-Ala-D-Ala endopeptidase (penicillin-binding protein 7)
MARLLLLRYIPAPMRYLIVVLLVLSSMTATVAVADPSSTPPRVAANLKLASVSALVMDAKTGETLFSKFDDVPLPIASVTKVMTAMVVLDGGQPLDEWLTIAGWDNRYGKNAYSRMRIGSQAKRGELVRIALMSSENLATQVLARNYPGGSAAFVVAMNAKAQELGMSDTVFIDPAGLSPDNRSTARDLSRMVTAAYEYPDIRKFSTVHQHTAHFRNPSYTLPYGNTNPLVASERWQLGLTKTGYLVEAGRCLVMVAQIDTRPVVIVLLNSLGTRTPIGDAGRVRRWLTTGETATVAGAALEYEQRVIRELNRIDHTAVGG